MTFCYGGLKIDPKTAQTQHVGGWPIPGLYAAGEMAGGLWVGEKALNRVWQAEAKFVPRMKGKVREGLMQGWHRAVERAKGWEGGGVSDQ